MRVTIETLVGGGVSPREISRRTGVDRKTIRRHAVLPNSSGVATGSDPAKDVALLTPRLWKAHFGGNPLRSDIDRKS
jgi:transposase